MASKNKQPEPLKQINAPGNGKFQTFAYYVAWLGFIGSIALALRDTLKTQEPPKKDEYYK